MLNKQKMSSIIIRKDRHNKNERKNILTAIAAAQSKLQRAIIYFRTQYPEKALQNIARAYAFTEELKSHA